MPDTTARDHTGTTTSPATGTSGLGPVRVGYGWACPACDLTTGHLASAAEAGQLAGVHDRLQHGGAPTAVLLGGPEGTQGLCESCHRAPATLVWDYPPAGAPFALCAGCAPTPALGAAAAAALLPGVPVGVPAQRGPAPSPGAGSGGAR